MTSREHTLSWRFKGVVRLFAAREVKQGILQSEYVGKLEAKGIQKREKKKSQCRL